MLSCWSKRESLSSRRVRFAVILASVMFSNFLTAYRVFVRRCFAQKTVPYPPFPTCSITLYCLSKTISVPQSTDFEANSSDGPPVYEIWRSIFVLINTQVLNCLKDLPLFWGTKRASNRLQERAYRIRMWTLGNNFYSVFEHHRANVSIYDSVGTGSCFKVKTILNFGCRSVVGRSIDHFTS
jgi:hypothetical protein